MSNFAIDIPDQRPDVGGRAAILVPSKSASVTVLQALKNGSGAVGFCNIDGLLTVYFENNRFNDSSLALWENKVAKAYDRMVKLMPTVNRISAGKDNFDVVGELRNNEINITNMEALTRWLEHTNALASKPGSDRVLLRA